MFYSLHISYGWKVRKVKLKFSFYAFSGFVQMFAEALLLKECGMMINYILQLGKITSEKHSSDQNTLGNFKHFSPLIGNGKNKT